jgi:flavin reductase (DIM6/NTAB) family NADH-FMN oxidoreductase RutF
VIVGIAIAPGRYSHQIIRETGEFVVNLPTVNILKQVDAIGAISGRQVDKFAMTGLTPLLAAQVRPPLIAECPVNLECRVLRVETIGDHDLFQGEVLVQHVDEAVLDEADEVDPSKLRPFAFLFWQYYAVTTPLGRRGVGRDLLPAK